MPSDNSLNPGKGSAFQRQAAVIVGKHLNAEFQLDYPIPIGKPPKAHRLDLVSKNLRFIGECKNYSWTESGNSPSAKMGFINEAILYLSYLPRETVRFIVMRLDRHARRQETLTQYYFRTYRHLLDGIRLFEVDVESGAVIEHL